MVFDHSLVAVLSALFFFNFHATWGTKTATDGDHEIFMAQPAWAFPCQQTLVYPFYPTRLVPCASFLPTDFCMILPHVAKFPSREAQRWAMHSWHSYCKVSLYISTTGNAMGRTPKMPQHPFLFASPWLLATAIGILLGIVIFFTVNNLQREQRLITESLFNRGMSVIRFVGAGTRASLMMGGTPTTTQMQHLVEQAAGESGIVYIAVVDEQNRILAHSNRQQVGATLDHLPLAPTGMPPRGRYQIHERATAPHKIFEVTSIFRPFHGRGHFFGRHLGMMAPMGAGKAKGPGTDTWCRQQPSGNGQPPSDAFAESKGRFIVVGLDMSEEEKVIRQDLYHILFISLAILLVGIGSWMALLSAQGYKTAQQTIQYINAFTGLLISRLPVGIIATDQEGRIKTFNTQAAELAGITTAAALNRRASEVLP